MTTHSRRHLLKQGLSLFSLCSWPFYVGCQQSQHVHQTLPKTHWPSVTLPRKTIELPSPTTLRPQPSRSPVATRPTAPVRAYPASSPIEMISRDSWTRQGPRRSDINPMQQIRRITIHHEGNPVPVTFNDYRSSARRMEIIRQSHRKRGWSDIGYHFVIDRSGRVWEGRGLGYQGAHVRNHNENNLGIMVLGNFDKQQPTNQQLNKLIQVVRHFRQQYRVSSGSVRTHQEITPTACPGRHLQANIVAFRRAGRFG